VPRDRDGSFEPELVKKGQTRIDGMDDKIIGLYAAGLTVRDIRAHLEDVYGLQVSPYLISRVTDGVLDEVREWQTRALDQMYPIVIFDALRVKIRDADSRMVKNKAVYVALGVSRDGVREVLRLFFCNSEGAAECFIGEEFFQPVRLLGLFHFGKARCSRMIVWKIEEDAPTCACLPAGVSKRRSNRRGTGGRISRRYSLSVE
jgi:hypothetical protein